MVHVQTTEVFVIGDYMFFVSNNTVFVMIHVSEPEAKLYTWQIYGSYGLAETLRDMGKRLTSRNFAEVASGLLLDYIKNESII